VDKKKAQKRVDRIRAFQEELETLKSEGALQLSEEQKNKTTEYHSNLISELNHEFDTDVTEAEKKISVGMRILTFLGGTALCASVFFFFYQIWGEIPTWVQIILLVASPILSLLLMEYFSKREKTFFYATLAALLAFICFFLNLKVLGSIFNITPSPNAFLAWGLFAMLIAYTKNMRMLLAVGLISLLGFLSAKFGSWGDIYWFSAFEKPENYLLAGLIILFLPDAFKKLGENDFTWIYRLVGLIMVLISILILSYSGRSSYFSWDKDIIEGSYQTLGFILAALTIWTGIKQNSAGITNIGSSFFTLYLYMKLIDWWWENLPKYLFFLLISLITIGLLSIFKRMRVRIKESV
jgi:uncharacterized membrane protein